MHPIITPPSRSVNRYLFQKKYPDVYQGIFCVHSRGIEPRLPAPQASVLSIKRRVRIYKNNEAKYT